MTTASAGTSVTPTMSQHWRTWRWVLLALLAVTVVAVVTTYLTAPRPGGRMDPASTGPEGTHALVALLRDQGVAVDVATTVAEVEKLAGPDAQVLVAQTFYLVDDAVLGRLSDVPGDLLLVEPEPQTRAALSPEIRYAGTTTMGGLPGCELAAAQRAGVARLGSSDTYEAVDDDRPLTRCYDGALVQYRDGDRTVTVVGSADFMLNGELLDEGNAALAMNLAGAKQRLVWYAPQEREGQNTDPQGVTDLIPDWIVWMLIQLAVVVLLLAWWQGRRLGPLVAENLPVVVRASETVEGRGRLYRSRRARDRAADALRTAALQRMLPRLGLTATAPPTAVAEAVSQRGGERPDIVHHALYGPAPATDDDLVALAGMLDNIERQVRRT